MEKNVQTELQLGEEQLQEIAGGCAQCMADLAKATSHQDFASAYVRLSESSAEHGLISSATGFLNDAQYHAQKAQTLLNTVAARHRYSGSRKA